MHKHRKMFFPLLLVLIIFINISITGQAVEFETKENTTMMGSTYWNLSPKQQYSFFVVPQGLDTTAGISPENLLYLDQTTTDISGTLSFTYLPNSNEPAQTLLRGENNKNAEELTWILFADGTLALQGTGDIPAFDTAPWFNFEEKVTKLVFDDSIVRIEFSDFGKCSNLATILFEGNAPVLDAEVFRGLTATVYYPEDNDTWTEDVLANYGGALTWIESHQHSYGEWQQLTAPGCETEGLEESVCLCGDKLTRTVDALGHDLIPIVTPPSCTDKGYTTHNCSRCEYSYTDNETDSLGHSFTNYLSNKDATCTEDGTKTSKCDNCDVTDTITDPDSTLGHNYEFIVTLPTCTEKGYTTHTCSACGDGYVDSFVNALDHNWDSGVVTKSPTEKEEGIKTYTCQRCDTTKTESIPKLEHMHQYTSAVTAPTCTKKGYTSHTCTCGDSYVDGFVNALDHNWDSGVVTKSPTEKEEGIKTYTCQRCGETKTESISKLDHIHEYTAVVTAPTYTEKGYTTHTCSTCGHSYSDSYVDTLTLPTANIQLARMVLGNELAMQFAFKAAPIVEGVDYVVSITKTYADGRDDKVVVVPQRQWQSTSSGGQAYYYVSFNGIAAKEMGDTIQIQIKTKDGTAVGEVYTDSVRDYAIRQLRKTTDAKTRTLYVDMLNYGAAAQTYFGYDASNLVTSRLTATEKGYGTKSVNLENNLVKGPGYSASQLNLASSIQLRIRFGNIDSSMYALIKFTNHMGREVEVRVDGSQFLYSGTVVVIDAVVAADYNRDVTVTVYNAQGNAVANAVESVASYLARQSDKDNSPVIYDAVAKYCAAAYAYLHK